MRTTTKIACISDTHLKNPSWDFEPADILVHAGDITLFGKLKELAKACEWIAGLPFKEKVIIAGNHDFCVQRDPEGSQRVFQTHGLTYLQDESITIEGLKFYGSPWTPVFNNYAFNAQRGEPLREIWSYIPDDTDILVTHGPPFGILDLAGPQRLVGCDDLLDRVQQLHLKAHIFGHIHYSYGLRVRGGTQFVNASSLGNLLKTKRDPIYIYIEHERKNSEADKTDSQEVCL